MLMMTIWESIENNPGTIIALLSLCVTVLAAGAGIIAWLVRIESKTNDVMEDVQDLYEGIGKMTTKFDNHLVDKELHMNPQFIGALKERIDRLEASFDDLKDKVLEKIDHRFDQLLTRLGK